MLFSIKRLRDLEIFLHFHSLQLCKCTTCSTRYTDEGVQFLLDEEDTVHHYERESKEKGGGTSEDKMMQALSEMDRTKQVEAIKSYNSMKCSLKEFLAKFAADGKVVKQEDIQGCESSIAPRPEF